MSDKISSVLSEHRVFKPSAEARKGAHISGPTSLKRLKEAADKHPVTFWEQQAKQLEWSAPWKKAMQWSAPHAKWFVGGKINASVNCLDRHLSTPRINKAALIWEGEPGEIRTLTYLQLFREVSKFANVLLKLGVKKGDVVGIYMGMVPEAVVAMLACARIGATHNVVFGGFSAEAVAERMNDSGAVALITQDVAMRRGSTIELKKAVDTAARHCKKLKHVVVYRRGTEKVAMKAGRDHWWHELMDAASADCPAPALDAEHPLFILNHRFLADREDVGGNKIDGLDLTGQKCRNGD